MSGYETKEQSRNRARKRRAKMTAREKRIESLSGTYTSEIAVYYVDMARCEKCELERFGHYIQIHHIDLDHYNNELSNTIGLCYYCHKDVHREMGTRWTLDNR